MINTLARRYLAALLLIAGPVSAENLRDAVATPNRVFGLSPDGEHVFAQYHFGASAIALARHVHSGEVFALYSRSERGRFDILWSEEVDPILIFTPAGFASCSPQQVMSVDLTAARAGFRAYLQRRASDSTTGRVHLSEDEHINRMVPHLLRAWGDVDQFTWPGISQRNEPRLSSGCPDAKGSNSDPAPVTQSPLYGRDIGMHDTGASLKLGPQATGERVVWLQEDGSLSRAVFFADPPFDITELMIDAMSEQVLSIRYFAGEPREFFLSSALRQAISRLNRVAGQWPTWIGFSPSVGTVVAETNNGFWMAHADSPDPILFEQSQPWRKQQRPPVTVSLLDGRRGISILESESPSHLLIWTGRSENLDLGLARGLAAQGLSVAWAAPNSLADNEMIQATIASWVAHNKKGRVCLWLESGSAQATGKEDQCVVAEIHRPEDWNALTSAPSYALALIRAWDVGAGAIGRESSIGPWARHAGLESDEDRKKLVEDLAEALSQDSSGP